MDAPHRRFLLAISLFGVWVLILAALAVASARRPRGAERVAPPPLAPAGTRP